MAENKSVTGVIYSICGVIETYIYIYYIYVPGTQKTLVLIGKASFWGVDQNKNRDHLGSPLSNWWLFTHFLWDLPWLAPPHACSETSKLAPLTNIKEAIDTSHRIMPVVERPPRDKTDLCALLGQETPTPKQQRNREQSSTSWTYDGIVFDTLVYFLHDKFKSNQKFRLDFFACAD